MPTINNIQPGQIVQMQGNFPALGPGQNKCTAEWTAQCGQETLSGQEQVCVEVETVSALEKGERGEFWQSQGYEEEWFSTPVQSDLNQSTSLNYFNSSRWTPSGPLVINFERGMSIATAPDGSIAAQCVMPAGETRGCSIKGQQLDPNNTFLNVVHCVDVFIESATSRNYAGVGHYWGSRPGSTANPGGGNHRNDSYAYRGTIAGSGNRALYAYDWQSWSDANPGEFGDTFVASAPVIAGRWVTHEIEINLNVNPAASDGMITYYRDGLNIRQITRRIRGFSDVHPKGATAFILHNAGAPTLQRYWMKNWAIYAK